jgi:flagellar hook-basal body complex protein FliE
MSIQGINSQALSGVGGLEQSQKAAAVEPDGKSFKSLLVESINDVNALQQDADRAVEGLFTGEDVNPAEVLTAVQKADLAFRMMMQIRNKLVAAYDEVKNIRI